MNREEFIAFLEGRKSSCFLCAWALQDLEKNGKFTDYPKNSNLAEPLFSVKSKKIHLLLEGIDVGPSP